jgi:hypothetical protein
MWKLLAVLFLAGAALLPRAAVHAAGPPLTGCGTFAATESTTPVVRSADGNTILTARETDVLTGLLSGTVVADQRIVFHPTGTITGGAVETFTGSVAGHAGAMVFRAVVTGDATSGAFQGQFTVLSGTGGLANLHGHGTFTGSFVTGSGTYCAQVVFAP